MTGSLRALLYRVIDYAGTFPPERLPLDEAAHRYEDHRDSNHSWMLGRFVIQSALIPDLRAHFSGVAQPKVSALLPACETVSQFFHELDRDLAGIEICNYSNHIRMLEGRLPLELASARTGVDSFIESVQQRIMNAGLKPAGMYWEAAGTDRTPLWLALAGTRRSMVAGFKQRTGGLEASAVPSSTSLIGTLEACRAHHLSWKATAGLHQPLPHHDEKLGVTLHGFVNLLAAAAFAYTQELPRKQLIALLDDADPAHFQFTDEALTWRDQRITTEEIAGARTSALVSFGSCSFDEPLAALQSLGWL